jgi:hypothetical protein
VISVRSVPRCYKQDELLLDSVSHSLGPPEAHLTLNGRNIPFINHVKYLGVIIDKRITWRLHVEIIEPRPSEHLLQSNPYLKVRV